MIRSFFEKRRVRKALGRYVRPEAIETILRGDGVEGQPFAAARIEFVLAFVDGKVPEEISEQVGRVVGVAISHDGVVHDIIGALVVIAFGTLRGSSVTVSNRSVLVEHLSRDLSSHVKIVHGAAEGYCGLFGNKQRMAYSFVLPGFDAVLGSLSSLEFGQIEELKADTT